MSTPVAALCQTLIEDIFGDLAAQLFETLTNYGRLSLQGLTFHSGLTPRQVRHALAILVQQNLVVWSSDGSESVSYEAHVRNAYYLVRQGRYARVVGERFGKLGQSVGLTILQSGHGKVSDVVSSIVEGNEKQEEEDGKDPEVPEQNGTRSSNKINGTAKKESEARRRLANEIRVTILAMIDVGYLTIVHRYHFRPTADNKVSSNSTQRMIHGDKVKKAEEADYNSAVRDRMVDWLYNRTGRNDLVAGTESLKARVGQKRKRKAQIEPKASKRVRADDATLSGENVEVSWNVLNEDSLSSLDNFIIKVNFDKLSVIVRNEKLAELVSVQIGQATSLIYEELLDRLGKPLLYCKAAIDTTLQHTDQEDEDLYSEGSALKATTKDIASSVDLSGVNAGFGKPPSQRKSRKTVRIVDNDDDDDDAMETSDVEREAKVRTNGSAYGGNNDDENDDDDVPPRGRSTKNKRSVKVEQTNGHGRYVENDDDEDINASGDVASTVKQHLLLLKNHETRLAQRHDHNHMQSECWSVDFEAVSHHLRLNMVDDIISKRFGVPALRLVRIMREKGKLEQKHLSVFSLMNHKTQLALLTALHTHGYIELQEVPKDSTRAPGKTIFLWFFDERRCVTKMLEDTYKAMTRMLQRVRLESEKFHGVIEKVQRSDVEGNEEEMLTKHEKALLDKWYEVEERLMTEVGRVDDVVYCLRDF